MIKKLIKPFIILIVAVIIVFGIIFIIDFMNNSWKNKFDFKNVEFDKKNEWIKGIVLNDPDNIPDLRFKSGYLNGTISNKTNERYKVTINADFYDDIKGNRRTGSNSTTVYLSYNESENFKISIPKYTSDYKITKVTYEKY